MVAVSLKKKSFGESQPLEEVATPDLKMVSEVAEFLTASSSLDPPKGTASSPLDPPKGTVTQAHMVKTMIYTSEKEELVAVVILFFFKQKTAYEIRPRDWSSDVCSSDLCNSRSWGLFHALPVSQ